MQSRMIIKYKSKGRVLQAVVRASSVPKLIARFKHFNISVVSIKGAS